MRASIGIYNLHMRAMGGGEKLTLVLAAHLSQVHNVTLFCAEPLDIPSVERFFGVDLSRVTVSHLKNVGPLSWAIARSRGKSGRALSLHHHRQLARLNLDIFINNSYASGLTCPTAKGIFMCMFPHATPPMDDVIDSYSLVAAISQYSADWVRQMWARRSEIIYPPCDDMGPPAAKQNIILHVGRFIADNNDDERHHKAQDILLDAFKQMTDLHRQGWELHFSGRVGPDPSSRKFTDNLVQNACGFPVFFHFNSPLAEMRDLYRRAAIYWHATGYGFDANKYPAKQEHFGISTVEAMSAAAVPVVYSSGGQREIVTDGVDGLWWEDIDGLLRQTRRLVNDSALRCRLGQEAIVSSKRFGRQSFATRVDQLMEQLLSKRD